jgi:hypothetical protein
VNKFAEVIGDDAHAARLREVGMHRQLDALLRNGRTSAARRYGSMPIRRSSRYMHDMESWLKPHHDLAKVLIGLHVVEGLADVVERKQDFRGFCILIPMNPQPTRSIRATLKNGQRSQLRPRGVGWRTSLISSAKKRSAIAKFMQRSDASMSKPTSA